MRRAAPLRACFLLAAILFAAAGCRDKKHESAVAPTDDPQARRTLDDAAARAAVQELAGPVYQQWSTANPRRPCPSIDELAQLAPKLSRDPWGHPYRARCSAAALAGTAREVMISSNGADGLPNTDDDIKSK